MSKDSVSYRVAMLFCSNLILQLMGFVYRIALSRSAPASALGLNSLIMQIYGIVVSVCISGLNIAVSGLAAKHGREKVGSIFSSALIVYCALYICAALPIGLFSKRIGRAVLGNSSAQGTLLLMLACIFLTGVENVLKSVHFGTGHVRRCAVSELIEQSVRFVLVIVLLKSIGRDSDAKTVFLIMLGMLMSETVSVTNLSVSYARLFGGKRVEKRGAFILPLAGIAFPATLTAVSSTVFSSIGALRLPVYLMRSGLGYEAALSEIGELNTVCMPIAALPMSLALAVSTVLMPETSRLAARGRDPMPLIKKAFALTAAAGCCSLLLLGLVSGRAASLFFGREADMSVMILLLFRTFALMLQAVSISAMNGLMMQKRVLFFAVTGEAYQLLLISLAAPALGVAGYITASAAGEAVRLACNLLCIFANGKNRYGNQPANMIKSYNNPN